MILFRYVYRYNSTYIRKNEKNKNAQLFFSQKKNHDKTENPETLVREQNA